MEAVVEWVDARERLPRDGMPVAAAVSGRYPPDSATEPGAPSGRDFWIVRPVYFTTRHIAEDGTEHRDCFVDSDDVIRLPYGRPCAESVTHWAELPALPGTTVHLMLGENVRGALRDALD
jgi:hypothetical protein